MDEIFSMNQEKIIWEHIKTFERSQADDYTTGYLQDYLYFKNYFKMIAI